MPNKKYHVLIVEDNEQLLATYVDLFSLLGFAVTTANDGADAWTKIVESPFDIVFTDIKMPNVDGVELLRRIRARDNYSPSVIVTSGYTNYPTDMLLHLGANGFLAKPVNAESIRETLNCTVAKKADVWARAAKSEPQAKISKTYRSFKKMIDSGDVRFGNGGFYIRELIPNVFAGAMVEFHLKFEEIESLLQISGIGEVKWANPDDTEHRRLGLGLEIKFLSADCRMTLIRWIQDQKFTAYIPMS